MTTASANQRGVSLIEAVVALAVMAFGLVGVVGLQASLRANADAAKQRSEAVRIAQQAIEQRRQFSVVATTPGRFAFEDIISRTTPPVVGTNASFTLVETVIDNGDPRHKSLNATVSWVDRANQTQSVSLNTVITAATPELSAALTVPAVGATTQVGKGRNASIPPSAQDLGNGNSQYSPPGAGTGVTWIFDNSTGVVIQTCITVAAVTTCDSSAIFQLLAGFVLFSTGAAAPTPVDADNPTSTAFSLGVTVTKSTPTAPYDPPICVTRLQPVVSPALPKYLEYACLIPVLPTQKWWTGDSILTGLPLATSASTTSSSLFRVCRYTPDPLQTTSPPLTNDQHPLQYVNVDHGLLNQNFLVIRAGDNGSPFTCPLDLVTSPNLINTNTLPHQPSS